MPTPITPNSETSGVPVEPIPGNSRETDDKVMVFGSSFEECSAAMHGGVIGAAFMGLTGALLDTKGIKIPEPAETIAFMAGVFATSFVFQRIV